MRAAATTSSPLSLALSGSRCAGDTIVDPKREGDYAGIELGAGEEKVVEEFLQCVAPRAVRFSIGEGERDVAQQLDLALELANCACESREARLAYGSD